MGELLANWLPKNGSPDRRGWEWFYLHSLPDQNVRTFTEGAKGGRPSTVAWHAASNRLAEGTSTGLIRVWDVDRQRPTLTLNGPAPVGTFWGTRWLAWSPDGRRLAAGGNDKTVRVWEPGSGRELHVFRDHTAPVMAVAFSFDGTRLAAWGGDGKVKIWVADTGRPAGEVVHPGGVSMGA
jgi:WD40 repeat protein